MHKSHVLNEHHFQNCNFAKTDKEIGQYLAYKLNLLFKIFPQRKSQAHMASLVNFSEYLRKIKTTILREQFREIEKQRTHSCSFYESSISSISIPNKHSIRMGNYRAICIKNCDGRWSSLLYWWPLMNHVSQYSCSCGVPFSSIWPEPMKWFCQ